MLSCYVLQIEHDTNDLLRSLNMVNLPGVKMVPVSLLSVLLHFSYLLVYMLCLASLSCQV